VSRRPIGVDEGNAARRLSLPREALETFVPMRIRMLEEICRVS
jgi:hypothetical protein